MISLCGFELPIPGIPIPGFPSFPSPPRFDVDFDLLGIDMSASLSLPVVILPIPGFPSFPSPPLFGAFCPLD